MCFGWVDKYSRPQQWVGKPPFSCWFGVLSPCHPLGAPALQWHCEALLCCAFCWGHLWAWYAGQHCVVLQLKELVFSLVFIAFFLFFPCLFLTGHYPLHLNLFVCILGLCDVSSVLGPVSGICLLLGLSVVQSTAYLILLLLMLPRA